MNLLLFHRHECEDGRLRLAAGDRRLLHICEVLASRRGDSLRAGELNGPRGVVELCRDPLPDQDLELRFVATDRPGPPMSGQVFLALPRPQSLKKVLFLLPQIGVRRLVLLRSSRVEKSFFHSPLLHKGEWRRHLWLGMEQAGQSLMPELRIHQYFRPFIEDQVPKLTSSGARLLLHPGPDGNDDLVSRPALPGGEWALAIGPEGGWQEHELDAWRSAGFTPIGLGARILRVESALHHAVAQLQLLAHRKDS